MMRCFLFIIIGSLFSLFETSFLSSSVGLIRYTPFVFAISIYFVQHNSIKSASGFMIIHGILLDVMRTQDVSFLTVAYTGAAFVAVISAEKLFSNRSIYGVLACAFMSYFSLIFFEILLFFLQHMFKSSQRSWFIFFQDFGWRSFSLLIFLIILFLFAKQIRQLLAKFFFLNSHPQTY